MDNTKTHSSPETEETKEETVNELWRKYPEECYWLSEKQNSMRDEDLSIYSRKIGLCSTGHDEYGDKVRHIQRHDTHSCNFIPLVLDPLLIELGGLNQELANLGIQYNPSRSINEVRYIINNVKNKKEYPSEYSWVQSIQAKMRNEDLSTYSKKQGLCSNTYSGYGEEVRHIQRRGPNSCNFVPLILNPLLRELGELNRELANLGIPHDPSMSINEARSIIETISTQLMTQPSALFGEGTSNAQQRVMTSGDTNSAIRKFLGGKKKNKKNKTNRNKNKTKKTKTKKKNKNKKKNENEKKNEKKLLIQKKGQILIFI